MTNTGFMAGSHFSRAYSGVKPVRAAREIHRKNLDESKLQAKACCIHKLLSYKYLWKIVATIRCLTGRGIMIKRPMSKVGIEIDA